MVGREGRTRDGPGGGWALARDQSEDKLSPPAKRHKGSVE